MKINPIYKKELKISVRTVKMSLIIFGYNLILALIGLFSFFMNFQAHNYTSRSYSNILDIYMIIAMIEFGLILFIVPAFTANAVAGERERQTLDILLTSRLKPIQIIAGKLASSISMVLLLVISSLPILSIVFTIGGIRFRDLLEFIFLALVTAVFIGSIGIFFSALFKKTVPATAFTYGVVILLTIGILAIIYAVYYAMSMHLQKNGYNAGSGASPNIGNFLLICLIDPIITLGSMLTHQYGSGNVIENVLTQYGTCNSFFTDRWFEISITIQLFLSGILIFCSSRLLNPLKCKKNRKKRA
jgi:ABC-2 type transporter.